MSKVGIGFVCVLIGCAAGAAMPSVTAQSFGPNPSAQRWDQFCEKSGNLNGINAKIRQRGLEGWELVTAYDDDAYGEVACFKRPSAK